MVRLLKSQTWKSGIAVLFLTLLFSCSTAEVNPDDPASLAKDAEAYIDSNRYVIALERLQELKNRHPYSSQAIEAHLRIADVYFLQENFPEAAATYEAFRDLHPKHPKVAYAMYRAALSYYNDIPGNHARDLTPAFKAQDSFNEFLRQFPSNEFTADAKEKLVESRNAIADKEIYIGDFYYRRDEWESAKSRYLKVVNFYNDTQSLKHAEDRVKSIEEKLARANQ